MDSNTQLAFVVMLVSVVMASMALAWWLVAKLRQTSDQPLAQDMTGVTTVPVRQLERQSGFFGRSRNGINPRLEIMPGGLSFKVFKRDQWRFADIVEVDAPPTLFATRLVFRSRTEGSLYVDLASKERARDLLRALPRDLNCSRRALVLRDDSA